MPRVYLDAGIDGGNIGDAVVFKDASGRVPMAIDGVVLKPLKWMRVEMKNVDDIDVYGR